MTSSISQQRSQASRQKLAAAIWAVALLSLTISIPAGLASYGTMLLVSLASTLALYLVWPTATQQVSDSIFAWRTAILISSIIPITWAIVLGFRNPIADRIGFGLIAMVPGIVALITFGTFCVARASRPCLPQTESPPIQDAHRKEDTASGQIPTATFSITKRSRAPKSPETNEFPFSDEPVLQINQIQPSASKEPKYSGPELDSLEVTQWIRRTKTSHQELIEGEISVEFADGQKEATVHLSFCPPFRQIPQIETEDLDGSSLEIRVAAAFAFGARLTVRRTKQYKLSESKAETVRIGFVAISEIANRRAG